MPTQVISKNTIPSGGLEISASPGKGLTRVHLDLAQDGIALSLVGAASAALPSGNRHVVRLTPGKDGIALAMVGAASAAKR
jgi:hypothetical protein